MSMQNAKKPGLSLRGRTMLCIGALIGFVVLVTLVYALTFRALRGDLVTRRYNAMAEEIEGSLADSERRAQELTTMLSYSTENQKALYAPYVYDRFQYLQVARDMIYNFKNMDNAITSILLSDASVGRKISLPDSYTDFEMETIAATDFEAAGYMPVRSALHAAPDGSAQFLYMTRFREVQGRPGSSGSQSGVCAILYDAASFAGLDAFLTAGRRWAVLRDSAGSFVLGAGQAALPPAQEQPIAQLNIGETAYYGFSFEAKAAGWQITCYFPQEELLADPSDGIMGRLALVIALAALAAIGTVLANLLFVARNIHTLSASVAGIPEKRGSRAAAAGLPEMQGLADQVNDMLARIDQANTASAKAHQKVYEATLAKQSAQMAFYRSQIDPHFLFNTLECMRSMAQHYGVPPLEEMIGSTNQLLRYSLHAPFIVTLREELEAASAYMRVMNQRTMERYQYDLRVEEGLLQRPVLSMLLQPLMENAVRHGARHMGKRQFVLTLEVTADANNEDTVLRLTDNGCGIPPEMVDQLNADITEDHDGFGESIGVRNLRRRLAATDSRCSLRFASRQDEYTTVTVRLPRTLALPEV